MRSKKVTVSVPWRLWEAYEKHSRVVGYRDAKQLIVWSPLYSLSNNNPHHVTVPIAKAPPEVQDEYVNDVVDKYDRGEFSHSSYLEHVIEDAMKKLGVSQPKDVVLAVIRDCLSNRPKGSKKKEE